jgi:hypothetical protein
VDFNEKKIFYRKITVEHGTFAVHEMIAIDSKIFDANE